jgi:Bacteriophage minor capsid protein
MISRALAKYLDVAALAEYRPDGGGDCFLEHLPDSPDEAIGIYSTGGNPLPASDTYGYDEPTVQLMVRGEVDDPLAPKERADGLYAALQGLRYVTLDSGGEDEVFVVVTSSPQTAPVNIGSDETGRYRYTLNFALHVRALTAHRD